VERALLKLETIREAPKALLYDHLDGGLRPETVIELAADVGYRELPTGDPVELGSSRSLCFSCGRRACRRRIDSSWRRTRSSSSFEPSLRASNKTSANSR
jgi:Adenosine deaminase